jgi:hypothetical protein
MEVRFEKKINANCHPEDIWHIFSQLEDWHDWSGVFGHTGWVHGQPWQAGSRFVAELLVPRRVDLEVLVLKCAAPNELVLLCHGAGLAVEQWLHFRPEDWDQTTISMEAALVGTSKLPEDELRIGLLQMYEQWFDGLSMEAEKHCNLVAL